jgi:hypothetical protein
MACARGYSGPKQQIAMLQFFSQAQLRLLLPCLWHGVGGSSNGRKGVEAATSCSRAEQIGYRRCCWHHGYRHCRWLGGYEPSISLDIDRRHGYRHHRGYYRAY